MSYRTTMILIFVTIFGFVCYDIYAIVSGVSAKVHIPGLYPFVFCCFAWIFAVIERHDRSKNSVIPPIR